MASPKTLTNSVIYQDLQGNALANGYITLDLSGPAEITSGTGTAVPNRIIITLTAAGNIPGSTLAFGTDQLTPTTLTYRMKIYNFNDSLVADYGQQTITGASPIDLSALTPK